MANEQSIVVETALRVLRDHCTPSVINDAEAGLWPAALWNLLEETGLPLAWGPEGLDGSGASLREGFDVLRLAGAFAAPAPLAETMLAGLLLARAGIASPTGPMTLAPIHRGDEIVLDAGGGLRGVARKAPYARHARHLAVLAREAFGARAWRIALVRAGDCRIAPGVNLAGEAADNVDFDGARPVEVAPAGATDPQGLAVLGAATRAMQMAGGLETLLEKSLQYASERVQFGRPIGGFQAVQHNLAQLAGETAAAGAAADAAAEALSHEGAALRDEAFEEAVLVEVAAAKIRVGEAASVAAAIAHQVHGAMGFTYEHSLHQTTRRLWAWRDEFGDETAWSMQLGRIAARQGAEGLWPLVTRSAAAGAD